ERTDLVKRRRERDQPVAADATIRWLEADDAAQSAGLADRAAGVRAKGEWRELGADGCRGTAARAARHTVEVPRVAGRKEARVLGGRAHRELVHVRLAEQHGAALGQAASDRPVLDGDERLEDLRAGRRANAARGQHVLEDHRDAEQRGVVAGGET